ncbi:calcium-binding protein [Novosphingobium cyanobacteriorum]|uniref:Calcium-binding protein n=1 Tax=Novosphingobium cyanobacteriorum TaxID=3024215 RepID=A0ABT6CMP7_9SPHN|nr:calcium-binding protein [Novosphingobium cyanobacteriorum]MDF8335189.1 calcium-binding protein [Novosphingobium cyanobacteriorum]
MGKIVLLAGSLLDGGDDNDSIRGTAGDDIITGGGGNDWIDGRAGSDLLSGGTGADQISGGLGQDRLFGGDGDDLLVGNSSDDQLVGEAGNDDLRGGSGRDSLDGRSGNDLLDGGMGRDGLRGGDGDDVLKGGQGRDVLAGEAGDDLLDGGQGPDIMAGGSGDDVYLVDDKLDTVTEFVGAGSDTVKTMLRSYALPDNAENLFFAGTGSFSGRGNSQDNVICGGTASDFLLGGAGRDTFLFVPGSSGGDDVDTIGDFTPSVDRLDLTGFGQVEPQSMLFLEADGNDLIVRLNLVPDSGGEDALVVVLENVTALTKGDIMFAPPPPPAPELLIGTAAQDRLKAGPGGSTIIGSFGRDLLYCNAGVDRLVFAPGDSGVGSLGRDVIFGFESGKDSIDLTAFSGDLKLSFVEMGTNNWLVSFDSNGDGIRDTQIQVKSSQLTLDDILLHV